MFTKIKCKSCNKRVKVTGGDCKMYEPVEVGDKPLFLSSVVCPTCGARFYFQFDNAQSRKILSSLESTMVRVFSNRAKGLSVAHEKKEYDKQTLNLENVRKLLNNKYDGACVVFNAGTENEKSEVIMLDTSLLR